MAFSLEPLLCQTTAGLPRDSGREISFTHRWECRFSKIVPLGNPLQQTQTVFGHSPTCMTAKYLIRVNLGSLLTYFTIQLPKKFPTVQHSTWWSIFPFYSKGVPLSRTSFQYRTLLADIVLLIFQSCCCFKKIRYFCSPDFILICRCTDWRRYQP